MAQPLRSFLLGLSGRNGEKFRRARRAEYLDLPRLQVARLRAAYELTRFHSEGRSAGRIERAQRFVFSSQAAPARPGQLDAWVAMCDLERITWTGDSLAGDDWFPLGVLRVILDQPDRSVAVEVGHQDHTLSLVFRIVGPLIEDCEADQMAIGLADIGAFVDGRWTDRSVTVLVDREDIDRRIVGAIAEAARQSGLAPEAFKQSGKDPSTFTAISDTVVKVRLTFLYSRRAASLHDEWMTLLRLASHPGIVRPIGYQASGDWEMLELPKLEGQPLEEWSKGARTGHAIRRMLIRLTDVSELLKSAGVVHRDLLPHNLIVGQNEHLTLFDFDEAVVVHPEDIPSPLVPQTNSQLLLPWADIRDLVTYLGWERQWETLCETLEVELDAIGSQGGGQGSASEGAPRRRRDFWSIWHTIATQSDRFSGRTIKVTGPMAGWVAELMSIWAISDSTQSADRIPSAEETIGNPSVEPESRPDMLIALGPTRAPEMLQLAGQYDLAVFALHRPIDQAIGIGRRGLDVVPLSGPIPMVLVRRTSQ